MEYKVNKDWKLVIDSIGRFASLAEHEIGEQSSLYEEMMSSIHAFETSYGISVETLITKSECSLNKEEVALWLEEAWAIASTNEMRHAILDSYVDAMKFHKRNVSEIWKKRLDDC